MLCLKTGKSDENITKKERLINNTVFAFFDCILTHTYGVSKKIIKYHGLKHKNKSDIIFKSTSVSLLDVIKEITGP